MTVFNFEIVTLSNNMDKCNKWIVEFLSKFQGRGIQILQVNSIRVAKSLIFFNILSAIPSHVTS